MKIQNLNFSNFESIDFSQEPTVLITGLNSPDQKSNGVGKSHIFSKQISELEDILISLEMDPSKKH